jgi:beta-galactosidase
MDRRTFLKRSGTLAVGAGLAKHGIALAETRDTTAGRTILPLNRNWRYRAGISADAHQRGIDDSGFVKVTVPHTNIPLPWHGFDDKTYEFVSVYRRKLQVPPSAAGKRVFVDFEGVMLASTVYLNGERLGEYRGGFTPFSFELTKHLDPGGDNLLSLDVDSTERKDIPPFGFEVDYLTFGGIYREVAMRIVPQVFIENIYAQPKNVLADPSLAVACYLDSSARVEAGALSFRVELRDGIRVIAHAAGPAQSLAVKQHHEADDDQALGALPFDPARDGPAATLTLPALRGKVELWELNQPKLYTVHVQLLEDGRVIDEDMRRIGFREAMFTDHGFSLNGKIVKLHGLDRHQTFPWVGQAMPARVQRQDAKLLRRDMHCNIVRTSHYPQSRHFLDACDEMGLLVLEEIPGWQYIGDKAWQDVAVDNVRRMITRDWNRPSVVLWGVRINESQDNHDFYTRTNALAHALDPARQTGGIRYLYNSELLEDVFTMNDFGWPLRAPNHPRYLNTEFVGHTFPTKTIDDKERLQEHLVRHARVHDQLASDPQYAGGIGWCAFDYTTHANFGSGDRICYHGVMDIFRTPKPAANFYKSMCDPEEEIVLEPAFHWARNDESIGFTTAMISSNCDHLKLFIKRDGAWQPLAEADPDRKQFAHLKYAPFSVPLGEGLRNWGDLRIDGFVGGKQVISRTMSGSGVDHAFRLVPDDLTLVADGADTTRVVLRVEDEFGNIRPFAADAISFELTGPATLIGDNPFGLIGGTGAIWVRAGETPGIVTLSAKHPWLGTMKVTFQLAAAPGEL